MNVNVDEAGSNNLARSVKDLASPRVLDVCSNLADHPVFDRQVADTVQFLQRIDDAPALNQKAAHEVSTRSSTAMRTAIPFPTWFRMADRCESATSDEISRPRLMGPGCMTITSGLANSICSGRSPKNWKYSLAGNDASC